MSKAQTFMSSTYDKCRTSVISLSLLKKKVLLENSSTDLPSQYILIKDAPLKQDPLHLKTTHGGQLKCEQPSHFVCSSLISEWEKNDDCDHITQMRGKVRVCVHSVCSLKNVEGLDLRPVVISDIMMERGVGVKRGGWGAIYRRFFFISQGN